ncbi:hypothetical protein WJX82_004058 [Trebouxia sp. C0006]
MLSNKYTEAGLKGLTSLKTKDRQVANVVQAVAASGCLDVHLAFIAKEDQCAAEMVKRKLEIIRVFDTQWWARDWLTLDGNKANIVAMEIDPAQIMQGEEWFEGVKPDKEERMGNIGIARSPVVYRTYYKAALVIWPRKERTKTICEQGVDAALKQLAQMAAAAGGSKGGDDARELAKAIWDKFGLNGTGVEFVCSVQMLGMQELALQIRYRYQQHRLSSNTAQGMMALEGLKVLQGGTGPHAAPQEFVTQLGIKLIQTALQLAKQGVLAQDSSQQRLNTNLNVVVEAARFCSACIHSECSKDLPDIVTIMAACVCELEFLKPPPAGPTSKALRSCVIKRSSKQKLQHVADEINAFGKLVECTIREGTQTSRQIAANSKRKPWIMSCVKIRSRPDPAAKAYKLSMTKLANLKAAIDQVKGSAAAPAKAAIVCPVPAQQVDETKPCVQVVDLTEDAAPASKRQRV